MYFMIIYIIFILVHNYLLAYSVLEFVKQEPCYSRRNSHPTLLKHHEHPILINYFRTPENKIGVVSYFISINGIKINNLLILFSEY